MEYRTLANLPVKSLKGDAFHWISHNRAVIKLDQGMSSGQAECSVSRGSLDVDESALVRRAKRAC